MLKPSPGLTGLQGGMSPSIPESNWNLPAHFFAAAFWLVAFPFTPAVQGAEAAPTTGEADSIERLFRMMDRNGDGKLATNELGGRRRLFQTADKDGDGYVSREEARTGLSNAIRQWQERSFPQAGPEEDASATNASASAESPRQGPHRLKASDFGVGRLVPDVEFKDIQGRRGRLSEFQKQGTVAIAFLSTSCPLSKRYAPTLAGLEKEFRAKNVQFLYVDPILSDTVADLQTASRTHGFSGPVVRDTEGVFAEALGALSTTDVFVLDAARTLVYRGAVDDQYGLGYSLDAPRRRYLADALERVGDGRAPNVAATDAPGCALEKRKAKASATTTATYHNRISRLLQNNCLECHRQGGVAPFGLGTYEDVVGHAGMIRKQIERGAMPPWFAAPSTNHPSSPWANDRSLTARDKTDLLAWLDGSRPVGNPADAPLPRVFPGEWTIGTPDAIVQIPKPIAVAATGTMPYQDVRVPTSFPEDKWVRALEVQPSARDVVHHVLVFVRSPANRERTDERRRTGDEERDGFFAVYVPGNNALTYPDGFAKRLPAGATLKFQIHYTPNGVATNDQTRLGLVFAKKPPEQVVRVIGLVNPLLAIPPGASHHRETAEIPIPRSARLLALMPHMHLRGKAFRFEATFPDGRTETVLDVPHYDFNWQLAYRYAEPLALPRGSRLQAFGWYDNSSANPANPDPTKLVKWGPQTTDEMMLGYVEYYFPGEKP